MENKFNVGDKVRIVNYGHLIWENKKAEEYKEKTSFKIYSEDESLRYLDIHSEMVGKEGIISNVHNNQYSLHFDQNNQERGLKTSWYHENQLELIDK